MRQILSPLDGFGSPFGPQRGFNPRKLFALGEQGAWYDPSDLTTLFTDTAGTTPATVGSAVALMLDKSKGAGYAGGTFTGLGTELVNDGTFSGGVVPAGWTAFSGGTSSVSSGQFNVTASGGDFTGMEYPLASTTQVGRVYLFEATLVSGTARITIQDGVSEDPNTPNINYTGPTTIRALVQRDNAVIFTVRIRTSVNGATSVWDNISVRELPGNHATQSVLAQRPILRQTAGGLYYLECDGLDDGMVTSAINFTATDKVTVFAGVRKLSDAAEGWILELSATSLSNNGTFGFNAPAGVGNNYRWRSRGTAQGDVLVSPFVAPISNVITGIGDISADASILRVNGVQAGTSATDQGTGNYGNYQLFLFRRGGTTGPFNGHFYGGIVLGRTATAAEITNTERYMAQKTGVTLA